MTPSSGYLRLEQHAASRAPILIGFLWGLAEATLFFVVPDVYLGLVALFNWRRGAWTTAAAAAGAMIGGAGMYALAAQDAQALTQVLTHVPLISYAMVQTVGGQLQESGLLAMVTGPLEGIPYKVYAVQAGAQHSSFAMFLLMTSLARLERLLPVAVLCAIAGTAFRKIIVRHTLLVVGAYALLWVGIYVFYYLRFR